MRPRISHAVLHPAGGKDVKKHIQETRAARNMPPVVSPSGSRPTSPSWTAKPGSSSGASASTPLTPRALHGKDVEVGECINSPRGVGAAPQAAAGAGAGAAAKMPRNRSTQALTDALEHACPDGHAAALEGHHPPQMADGLLLEEDEEGHMLEFKETSSEVGLVCSGCAEVVVPSAVLVPRKPLPDLLAFSQALSTVCEHAQMLCAPP